MTKYQVKGITDAVNTCECCGKSNLKSTVALEEIESGAIQYYGSTCAAYAVSGRRDNKKLAKEIAQRAYWMTQLSKGTMKDVNEFIRVNGLSAQVRFNFDTMNREVIFNGDTGWTSVQPRI